jgi:hypothetical protein
MAYVQILLIFAYGQWLENAAPYSSSLRFLSHLHKLDVNSY